MAHRVLIIEPDAAPPLDLLRDGFPARIERVRWGGDGPPPTAPPDSDLVVPVGIPPTPALPALLDWARAGASSRPLLGVLARDAPGVLLHAASRALDDFVLWPAGPGEIECRVLRLLGQARVETEGRPREAGAGEVALRSLIGESPVFRRAVARIPLVAAADAAVLVTGETGTGKELAARAIHALSRRRDGPFVPVDCGALPETLFENEMFGHERGAFTDAHRRREGLVALAAGGTLFLDEVDALGSGAQAKLLRLLQEGSYRPLGGDRFLRADVRILAATNRDLEGAVRSMRFRADLFFRLDVLRLHLPPLREREGDAVRLAEFFLETLTRPGDPRRALTPAAARKLSLHPWPGNVRELWTALQRAVVFAPGPRLVPSDLALTAMPAPECEADKGFRDARADAVAAFERAYVGELLRRHAGNITRAAREARAERRSFGRLAKKYGLRPRDAGETSGAGVSQPTSATSPSA